MTPKFYPLLQRCIEDGLVRGWDRAHKHVDDPGLGVIQDMQYEAVMSEICEWFDFPEAPSDNSR